MKGSKYEDIPAVTQMIGCVLANPHILRDSGVYFFKDDDFTREIHRIIFGAAYNLIQMGSNDVSPIAIDAYLEKLPNSYGVYNANNGPKLVQEWKNNADPDNFEYYYNRIKKMTLLRSYESLGMDLNWLYDPDVFIENAKKSIEQEEHLNAMSLAEIADEIDGKIQEIRTEYVDNSEDTATLVGDFLDEYIESLEEAPAIGYPMYGKFVNMVRRGARLGKFYLRSAATGVGNNEICRQ